MAKPYEKTLPLGYEWRSSQWFILVTIAIALFADNFLYGFLVPILGYMLKNRLHSEPSRVQELSSTILGIYGALGAVAGPIIGHFADKSPDRKMPLLISLSLCILGTFLVAGAESLIMLFLGRMMQGIAGSAVWIVGFATIADTMTPDRVGFGMSFMLSFANSGTIGGPMISGLLLETTGYWATWSVPLLVLTIDLIARVVMIQTPAEASASPGIDSTRVAPLDAGYEEQDTLSKKESFWRIILLDGRVITCLLTTILSMSVTGSFEATIPLYVLESFGWGPSTVGILFSGLVIPGIMVGPIAGWVHDRIGARLPALICSVLQAAILVALGGTKNKPIFIACIIAIGTLRPFVSGIAPAELTAAAKALQRRSPGTFGANGGMSRVISTLDVAGSLGMALGPFLGGLLKGLLGFKYMTWTWSLLYLIMAWLVSRFFVSK